jgi:hypothetical protein
MSGPRFRRRFAPRPANDGVLRLESSNVCAAFDFCSQLNFDVVILYPCLKLRLQLIANQTVGFSRRWDTRRVRLSHRCCSIHRTAPLNVDTWNGGNDADGNSRPRAKSSQPMVPLWSRPSKCFSTALRKMTLCCRDSFLTRLLSTWKW